VTAILALPRPLCLAGSIALAAALAPHLDRPPTPPGVPAVHAPALVVSGSLHSRARAQIDALLATGRAVALALPAAGDDAAQATLALAATRALAEGATVVLAPAPPPSVPSEGALRTTEHALAEAVAAIAGRTTIATLVLIGGESSYAILGRLAARAIVVHGRIAPLIAHGTILDGVAAGVTLVTKGGSGGEPDVLARLIVGGAEPRRRAAEGSA
jgi:uncharacterized protein YgbK (DUF1537 family)